MKRLFLLSITFIFYYSLVNGQTTKYSKIEAHISKLIQQSVQDYNQGRYEEFVSYFSENYVRIKSGKPTYSQKGEGKKVLLNTILQNAASFDLKLEIIPEVIRANRNLAYDRGTFILSFKPRDGGEWQVVKRRYLEVWEKEKDQQWRIIEGLDIDYYEANEN